MHGQGVFCRFAGSGCRGSRGRAVPPQGGRAVRGEHFQRDPLDGACRSTGTVRPRPVGGDKRSGRIEACAPVILQAVEAKPDITLVELRA